MALIDFRDVVFVYHMHEEEEKRWHGRYHSHNPREYELHYFIQGEGNFYSGETYHIQPGSLFISPPGESHQIRVGDMETPLSYYAILFEIDLNDREVCSLMESLRQTRHRAIGSNFRFFFEEVREKALSSDFWRHKSAMHQFISFLYLLNSSQGDFHYGDERNRHIERALKIMQESVFHDLDLGALSRRLNLSESYFIRLFKEKMKMTPMKYFTRLRVEAASSLLSSTNLTSAAIAERLNFYSEFHFSRVFKQYTSYSPRAYRQRFLTAGGTLQKEKSS
ncbi:MAG: helix-turn-helix transcriptional regulator [Spirochaetales bacterium]|nr:helix-turn-helix transcriptional regulator [Spirochaetales bacterium]